jgi:hypothetical protein
LATKDKPPQNISKKRPPARTPEARESQLIALAMDLVEKRLREGTASSQETVTIIKFGSEKERLERDRLRKENELITAKTEAIKSAKRIEELYADAIKAFGVYSGNAREEEDED